MTHNITRGGVGRMKPNYKAHIKRRGYTQIELARHLGISYAAMNNFINGRAENLHIECILRRWIRSK